MRRTLLFLILFGLIVSTCRAESLKMATTTSVENSGLLDVLLSAFEQKFGIKIHPIAVGTGKALKLAENGDVDLVMVHCPQSEIKFLNKGFGIERETVFYNDFVIVGPAEDPARVGNLKNPSEAFKAIAQKRSIFVSRGDASGTYQKEMEIWSRANLSPQGSWYIQSGQGMAATLLIADEKNGYCLVDRGTLISYEDKIRLVILHEADPFLINPYSVIIVNPALHPHIKYSEAKLFLRWIGSKEGKAIISGFRKRQKTLFHSFD